MKNDADQGREKMYCVFYATSDNGFTHTLVHATNPADAVACAKLQQGNHFGWAVAMYEMRNVPFKMFDV